MNLNEFQSFQEIKKHTKDVFPYNTYLCSIPLDFDMVPLHWHQEVEFIVIKKGEGLIRLDFESHHVNAGDIIIVLPEHLHEITQSEDHKMEYENIIFKKELLCDSSHDVCSTGYFDPLFHGNLAINCHIVPHITYYDEFLELVNQLDYLSGAHPTAYELAIKGCLFRMFYLLIANQNKRALSKTELKSLDKIKFIVKYIEDHYSEEISVADMASLCYFSESHFMKFFKANMGTSFINYVNDYRLTMAAKLLRSTSDNTLTIAEQVGFDNLSYFNRIFKRKYGITPTQMR